MHPESIHSAFLFTHFLCFSLIPKWIQYKKVHKYSQPLLNTLLKLLWQQLQPQVFLSMILQAWHTYFGAVSPILLCRTSQAPSGWMGSVGAQPFSDLSTEVLGLAGPIKDIHRVVPKPLPCYIGCVLRVFVLLEVAPANSWKSPGVSKLLI